MDTLIQDLKFGLRTLVTKPAFTAVAVLSLALGIGANTAIFTVINAVFLHPLAIEDPARVAELFTRDTKTVQAAGFNLTPTSLQNFKDYRDQNAAFSALAGYVGTGLQWTHEAESEGMPGMLVTANYFDVLGIKPFLGRLFRPDEDLDNPAMVAVLSHSVWASRFGADRGVINTTITLNGLPFTVVGVTPPGFKGTASLAGPDRIWVPLGMREQLLTGQIKALMGNRRFRWVNIVGRLKPGVSLAQAQAAAVPLAKIDARTVPSDQAYACNSFSHCVE